MQTARSLGIRRYHISILMGWQATLTDFTFHNKPSKEKTKVKRRVNKSYHVIDQSCFIILYLFVHSVLWVFFFSVVCCRQLQSVASLKPCKSSNRHALKKGPHLVTYYLSCSLLPFLFLDCQILELSAHIFQWNASVIMWVLGFGSLVIY